jgi:urea transporter
LSYWILILAELFSSCPLTFHNFNMKSHNPLFMFLMTSFWIVIHIGAGTFLPQRYCTVLSNFQKINSAEKLILFDILTANFKGVSRIFCQATVITGDAAKRSNKKQKEAHRKLL